MITAVSVEQMIAITRTNNSDSAKLLSQAPDSSSLLDVIIPVIAPTMKTSPWAKLMKPNTP